MSTCVGMGACGEGCEIMMEMLWRGEFAGDRPPVFIHEVLIYGRSRGLRMDCEECSRGHLVVSASGSAHQVLHLVCRVSRAVEMGSW